MSDHVYAGIRRRRPVSFPFSLRRMTAERSIGWHGSRLVDVVFVTSKPTDSDEDVCRAPRPTYPSSFDRSCVMFLRYGDCQSHLTWLNDDV